MSGWMNGPTNEMGSSKFITDTWSVLVNHPYRRLLSKNILARWFVDIVNWREGGREFKVK